MVRAILCESCMNIWVSKFALFSRCDCGGKPYCLPFGSTLERMGLETKIIEKSEQRCREISTLLKKATILCHDSLDLDFLLSEQVGSFDVFVCCTPRDDTNVLLSLLGKKAGSKHIIASLSDLRLSLFLVRYPFNLYFREDPHFQSRSLSSSRKDSGLHCFTIQCKANVVEVKFLKTPD